MTNVAGCSSKIRYSRRGCKKTASLDKLYGALVWQLDNRTSKAASTRVISLTTFEGLTFVPKGEGKQKSPRLGFCVPRPSSYPLLGPKYLLLGTIYPQLRVQGGSWYVILECSFDSSPRSLYVG